jgi:hypothetical protein
VLVAMKLSYSKLEEFAFIESTILSLLIVYHLTIKNKSVVIVLAIVVIINFFVRQLEDYQPAKFEVLLHLETHLIG